MAVEMLSRMQEDLHPSKEVTSLIGVPDNSLQSQLAAAVGFSSTTYDKISHCFSFLRSVETSVLASSETVLNSNLCILWKPQET